MSGAVLGNRLLVVAADPSRIKCLDRTAKSIGFEIAVSETPETLIQTVRQWRPTVIVLDAPIAEANAGELIAALAAEKCLAHIVLGAKADREALERTAHLGEERGLTISGVLPQPIRIQSLREMLCGFKSLSKDALAHDLAEALASDELFLVYQPKFDLRRGLFTGVEALLRWRHTRLGTIEAKDFITIAEEGGLIGALTDRVIAMATRQVAEWRADNLPLDLSINISAKDVEDIDLPARLHEHCLNVGVDPSAITLELTEAGPMHNRTALMMDVLSGCASRGFRLSIDDFGTGYSSLAQLQQMPLSELKIDRSFVIRIDQDESCRIITQIILDLARQLGLKSVAEGVEDAATLQRLAAMGCDMAQGHHLGQPFAATEVLPFITEHNSRPLLQYAV